MFVWLDACIRIFRTELFVAVQTKDNANIPQQTSGKLWCVSWDGVWWQRSWEKERKWVSIGKRLLWLSHIRPRVFAGEKYWEACWRCKCGLVSETNLWVVTIDCQQLLKDFQSGTEHPVWWASGRRREHAGIWCFWTFQTMGSEERVEEGNGSLQY